MIALTQTVIPVAPSATAITNSNGAKFDLWIIHEVEIKNHLEIQFQKCNSMAL